MLTYEEVLPYLYSLLPVFHRDGAQAYKPGLETIQEFCAYLGNPQERFKSIHVAGTNGKGSTSHWLASVFQSAGYRTGLYTSPHLKDFRERIRVDGQMVLESFVVNFVNTHRSFIEKKKPSFFEVTVAMAFQYFAENKVDMAIVEVGVGGRLDSTNIIFPVLSVITNIGWDHTDLLGDTLEKIAFEKAGIIKPNTPVVISERQEEVQAVFNEVVREKKALVNWASDDYQLTDKGIVSDLRLVECQNNGTKKTFELGLLGTYQLKNLRGVLEAIEQLKKMGWTLPDSAVKIGIRDVVKLTNLKGRWQKIGECPITYCDTAHNEAGIRELLNVIGSIEYQNLWLILGFVRDKDLAKIIQLLPPNAFYLTCQAANPRALPVEKLTQYLWASGLSVLPTFNVNTAIEIARQKADSTKDLVIVFGSTYLIAEIASL